MYKEEYGIKKSERMGMHRTKIDGKKAFWEARSMGNPKPKMMYKEAK